MSFDPADQPVPRAHGPWRIEATREVYCDPWLRVVRDEVTRPDGLPGSYVVAHVKPGVSVLAIDDQLHVHLTSEFHYAVGRETLEVVSGGREAGEGALETAQRELQEELGIEATDWQSLGVLDPFTAGVCSPTELYLARQLTLGPASPEGSEQIAHIVMPLQEAVDQIGQTITHAGSCVLLLRAWQQLIAQA